MTHSQRFDRSKGVGGIIYAPSTIGCPSMLFAIDSQSFKKSNEEKCAILNAKREVKKELGKSKHHKFQTFMRESF